MSASHCSRQVSSAFENQRFCEPFPLTGQVEGEKGVLKAVPPWWPWDEEVQKEVSEMGYEASQSVL